MTAKSEYPETSGTAERSPAVKGSRKLICRVQDVSFRYSEGVEALRDVSLDVERGRNLAVVGPSGCGKSTLLYVLAGLLKPAHGRAEVLSAEPGRHRLSMLFQKDTLLPWLTVSDNVALHGRFRRSQRRRVRSQVDWLLQVAGLQDFAKAYPYQLSGGMRRRVAFLTAVAPLPQVLLLDEPFISIDQPTQIGIHQDVLRISRDLDITLLLVTHDLPEALSLCDDVIVMTKRPGHVKTRIALELGDRDNLLVLRERPDFLTQYRELWHILATEIGKAQSAETEMPTREASADEGA